jgi:hypothetical protein
VLTSKRSQVDDVQYPRMPSKILKGASHEGVVNDETNEIMLILNVWSVETPRYPAWLQRVWKSHSRHADLRKVSNQKHPSTRKYLAGPLGVHPTGRSSFPT